jgi:multisubunit Na+/H+ antiporter MnhC subunit
VASHHPAVGERLATVAYAGPVKEFVVYTAMRIGLFVTSLVVVIGVWMLIADQVPVLWAVVIAFAMSGVASYFLLNRQREAFARRVERRAERMQERFERAKSREDAD